MAKTSVLSYKGALRGHGDMVTAISTSQVADSQVVISASRDKTLMVWGVNSDTSYEGFEGDQEAGVALRSLKGHGQAVSDCSLSSAVGGDKYAVSSSWDSTMKLWDLEKGVMIRKFVGHSSDVNSVAFSADSRQVVSGSRDKTIKIWNTRTECKFTSKSDSHTDWVSSVRFSPAPKPTVVSCSWDKTVKVWSLGSWSAKNTFVGHEGPVHSVTVSPDGSLCASGGRDSSCILWDLGAEAKVCTLDSKQQLGGSVNSLCFSPSQYWLCAAMDHGILIWELENKKIMSDITLTYKDKRAEIQERGGCNLTVLASEEPVPSKSLPWATCLQWDKIGSTLFVGSSNGDIHCFDLVRRFD